MKIPKLAIAMGYIEDELISEAIVYKPRVIKQKLLHYVAIAACVALVCIMVSPFMLGFIGNNATDIYRVGESLVITDIEDMPGEYNGKLLAENLDFTVLSDEHIRLYYDKNGTAENSDDWYSLTISAEYLDYDMTMYCLFDKTKSLEDWKVDMVFKPETTQNLEINGIDVQVAGRILPLVDKNQYYAIFEYKGVVYDIRVISNTVDDMYAVLNDILQDDLD